MTLMIEAIEPNHSLIKLKPHPTPPTPAQFSYNNEPKTDDISFKSTWVQQMWLTCACTTVLIALAKSITLAIIMSHYWIGPFFATLAGYVLADLASGIHHWALDNYGNATTPIVGDHIDGFQVHHKRPSLITKYEFANTPPALCQFVIFTFLPINLALNDPTLLALFGSFSGWALFTFQIHAWAHYNRNKLPPIVAALQDLGVIASHAKHAPHHLPPHNSNYCTVSGICNYIIDGYKVFLVLEKVIFFMTGVTPRSWNDPSLGWIEEKSKPSSLPE